MKKHGINLNFESITLRWRVCHMAKKEGALKSIIEKENLSMDYFENQEYIANRYVMKCFAVV